MLDFGLRAADLHFRELVVPGLGRIWFARQLTWSLAALALHEDLASHGSARPKPAAISHGIEALACKLEYLVDPQDPSPRILGRRAFGRDVEQEIWSFQQLHKAKYYVRNTHRQAAARALRVDGGLGFASGSRFDLLQLEPVGRSMANAFLEQRVGTGGTRLRKWILGWLTGERKIQGRPETLLRALSPENTTDDERALVRSRILETSTSASEKRQRLARAIGLTGKLPSIEDEVVVRLRNAGDLKQAGEIVAARAFGAVLDRARDAIASLTRKVEPERGGAKLANLARDPAVEKSIADLRSCSKGYIEKANAASVKEATSRSFAKTTVEGNDSDVIRSLVGRSGGVLALADSAVVRGSLFRVVDGADDVGDLEDGVSSIEPDRTGRTFRIANFHSLLRDVEGRGSQ